MLLGKQVGYFVQISIFIFFETVSLISIARADTIQDFQTRCFADLRGILNNNQIADLCQRATPYTSKCFSQTQNLIGNDQARELCRRATPNTEKCLTDTRSLVNDPAAIRLCQYASATTPKCFQELRTTLGTTEAFNRCIPSSADRLDACSQSILFDMQGHRNQISEAAALKYCSQP